jgi:hypothetical protein
MGNATMAFTVDGRLRQRTPHLICALLAVGFSFWENPRLVAREGPDTAQCVAVALSLHDDAARDRPPIYPFYLRLCMLTGDWKKAAVAGQKLSIAVLAAVLVSLLRRLGLRPGWSVAGALMCSISPSVLAASNLILPELGVAVCLAVLWKLVVDLQSKSGPQQVRAAAFAGLLSGAVVLLKPMWVGGVVFVGVAWLLAEKRRGQLMPAVAAMTACHFAVCGSWIAFLAVQFGQYSLSRTGTINFNLSAIRAGLVESGRGTDLYDHLAATGLLEEARQLKWSDFERFTRIKDAIPWEVRADSRFARQVARERLWDYVRINLARMPTFFITRGGDSGGGFPLMPSWLRRLYFRFFDNLVRVGDGKPGVPVLLILLLISTYFGLRKEQMRSQTAVGLSMIAYVALVLSLTTYQDQNFMRMRVEIEAVIMVVAGGPLAYTLLCRWRGRKVPIDV